MNTDMLTESHPRHSYDIDMVYLWVDGSDPQWRAKRHALDGNVKYSPAEDCKGRYVDNDELKYSLRSLAMYAPWIHHVYIVTDGQVPRWLDTSNPRVTIVDHSEILPPETRPCFNSSLIEHFLYRIPGLSEHFLFGNDDMFFNRPVNPCDFFSADDGLPIMRFSYRRLMRKFEIWYKTKLLGKPLNYYNHVIENSARLVEERYGRYYGCKSHHNIDAYLRSDMEKIACEFREPIKETYSNHVRQANDVQRHLYSYAAMAMHRAHRQYVGRHTSFHLFIHRQDHYMKLKHYNPMLFCMNDSEYADDEDRRHSKEFLKARFPEKTPFEK
ncbi:MAG: stealth family protein [Clostridiales bacterium]|nr:stealth family protein [Clostridiales bacterium]